MHEFVTHNHCYATGKAFCAAILEFLTRTVPETQRGSSIRSCDWGEWTLA
jgi:hypothetical protein